MAKPKTTQKLTPEQLDEETAASLEDTLNKQKEEESKEDGKTEKVVQLHKKKRLIGKDFDGKMSELLINGRNALEEIKKKRAALSTEKAAIVANWSAKGLSPDAIEAAAAYCEKSDDAKQNYDISYQFAREVFGEPVQVDMFEESVKAEIREQQAEQQQAE